jgi:hypothetical protein
MNLLNAITNRICTAHSLDYNTVNSLIELAHQHEADIAVADDMLHILTGSSIATVYEHNSRVCMDIN